MTPAQEQAQEFTKLIHDDLIAQAEKVQAECRYCFGSGGQYSCDGDCNFEYNEPWECDKECTYYADAQQYADCEHCQPISQSLRDKAGRYCWHEDWHNDWGVASRCKHCGVKNYSTWIGSDMGHTQPRPTYSTVEEIKSALVDVGEWEEFVLNLDFHVFESLRESLDLNYRFVHRDDYKWLIKQVALLMVRTLTTPDLLLQAVIAFMELRP